jgi:glycosyltransferase involved in cell wall biosynthesis
MKIFYLANSRIPTEKAHGLQIAKMCQALAAYYDVTLVVPNRQTDITQDAMAYYEVLPVFKTVKLATIDLVGKVQRWGFWLEAGIFFLAAQRLIRKSEAIIYSRELWLCYLTKGVVLELHALPHIIRPWQIWALRRTKRIFVLTAAIRERLLQVGISSSQITVLASGFDAQQFSQPLTRAEARTKLSLPQDTFLLGYIGMIKTMNMEKGFEEMITALSLLEESVHLLIVGGSETEFIPYRALSRKLAIDNQRIHFVPRRPYSEIPNYLWACDCLLMPFPDKPHYRHNMSPLKMFDYMASNRPIITTDLPTIREVLDESTALFVSPGSVQGLIQAVRQIRQQSETATQRAALAFARVQTYSWEQRAEKIYLIISHG